MSILVQREFTVDAAEQAEFERQSREGLWPAFLHFGALMVAFGRWTFNGPTGDTVVTHTRYTDFEHWDATRAGGAFYRDDAMLAETADLRPVYERRSERIGGSRARIIEVPDGLGLPEPVFRRAGDPLPSPPPTFGRGSVLSERTYRVAEADQAEFRRLSQEQVWPWLESRGGRLVAYGSDPLAPATDVVTLFAFRSLAEWHRLSRPGPELAAPTEVTVAWGRRHRLIHHHWGRLLTIGTDFGTRITE